jgi:hypothetical protein
MNTVGDLTGGADGVYDTNNWNAVLIGYAAYNTANYINEGNGLIPSPIWVNGNSMLVRTTSTDLISRINGSEAGYTYTSGTPPNGNYWLGKMNYGGSGMWGHHTKYRYYGFGSAMDASKRTIFDSLLNEYIDAVTTEGYFARMDEQPSVELKSIINTYINDLKSNGIWTELDSIVLMNLHSAQASTLDI